MHRSAASFPFPDIHTTSAFLKSLPAPYSLPPGILSVHTFHTPHMILSTPLYTTLALTGMPHLECPFHSALVPFVVRHVPDSSSTPFSAPLVAWLHIPPLLPLATSFLLSKENTLCTCVPPHLKHFTFTISCFLITFSFILHCITLLDNTSNLFWEVVPLFSFPSLFLQFQARCPNPLQLQHSHFFFPSNFALNEVRVSQTSFGP